MALIEGFRVCNYRALRDITLGKLSTDQRGEPLTPFTVVIGKNGAGKSTLFDAFGFVADCLSTDVETACDAKQPSRGFAATTVTAVPISIFERKTV
jgi:AAA15 family ATPase/GTPase